MTLSEALPQYSDAVLHMACSELMAKGLLRDEGIGRWDAEAMQFVGPTALAGWLQEWVAAA
jgi:hypothetical protein